VVKGSTTRSKASTDQLGGDFGLTRAFDGLGEDVSDADGVLAEDVGVDAQGYGGVGMAEAGGDDVDGDSREEQRGRVQVA
jgi:hypothetical protein